MRSTHSTIKQYLAEDGEKESLVQKNTEKEESYPDYDLSELIAVYNEKLAKKPKVINEHTLLHNLELTAHHFQILINYVAAHSTTPLDPAEIKARRNTMHNFLKLMNEVKKSSRIDLNNKKNFLAVGLNKLVQTLQKDIQSADLSELKEMGNPIFFNAIINTIHGELLSKIGKIEAMADFNNGQSPNFDESEKTQPLSSKEIEEEYSHRLDGELLSILGKSVPEKYKEREAKKMQRLHLANTVFRFTNTLQAKMNPPSTEFAKKEVKQKKSSLTK